MFATLVESNLSKWLTINNYEMSFDSLKKIGLFEQLKETMSSELRFLLVQTGSEKLEDIIMIPKRQIMAQTEMTSSRNNPAKHPGRHPKQNSV